MLAPTAAADRFLRGVADRERAPRPGRRRHAREGRDDQVGPHGERDLLRVLFASLDSVTWSSASTFAMTNRLPAVPVRHRDLDREVLGPGRAHRGDRRGWPGACPSRRAWRPSTRRASGPRSPAGIGPSLRTVPVAVIGVPARRRRGQAQVRHPQIGFDADRRRGGVVVLVDLADDARVIGAGDEEIVACRGGGRNRDRRRRRALTRRRRLTTSRTPSGTSPATERRVRRQVDARLRRARRGRTLVARGVGHVEGRRRCRTRTGDSG